jgi:DNA mismatch repair protein MutL
MPDSLHIRLLPPDVANKIAAGEVVERPASVLKELVENAIDSGATQIDVAIVAGGTRLVSVADNGSGMDRDDALLSIERHATSKIRDADDIGHIHTLGFRGEALAAISSVSRFRLCTRRQESLAGSEVLMSGGKLQDVRETGGPPGTLIEVRDLFFNIPARRKFLRSSQTETAHLRQMFLVHALAWPAVGMKLTIDGRDAWTLAAGATSGDRIRELFGRELMEGLRPIDARREAATLSGFVSLPTLNRGDRGEQYVFINGRPATAPVINYAIREAYHNLLADGRHPYVFLFIELPPEEVDVNVHPTKREVRFRNPSDLRDVIISGVRHALADSGNAFVLGKVERPVSTPPMTGPTQSTLPSMKIDDLPPTRILVYPRPPQTESRPAAPVPPEPLATGVPGTAGTAVDPQAQGEKVGRTSPWAWCRVIGQVGGLYVVLETEDGYVIMDPHAAHERVLFEQFLTAVAGGKVESQGLLVPETVEMPPRDAMMVRKNLDLLKKMGVGVSEFGGDTFVVDALPAGFSDVRVREMLVDVARHLETLGERGSNTRWREEAVAQAACKAATKARDRLSLTELERLVVQLAETEMPYTCPHGRPTLIHTSFKELAKRFGRE